MGFVTRRQGIVLAALAGFFVSLYLFLTAVGVYGELVCGAGGGCDIVQASRFSSFLGFPVAGWGVAWYGGVLGVSVIALGRMGVSVWTSRAFVVLATGGLAFSAYLTALEMWVIHAFCRWCVGSAIITVVIFLLTLREWPLALRDSRRSSAG